MAWNPEYLQKYEESMRDKRQQQEQVAERENADWDRREANRLRTVNAELLALLESIVEWDESQMSLDVPELMMWQVRDAIAKAKPPAPCGTGGQR